MSSIELITAREILDSRGNPTVEVDVILDDGSFGRAGVPSGASTGIFEAVELRDGEKTRYQGKGVQKAVDHILEDIAPQVLGMEASEQRLLDEALIELDGTKNKAKFGANAILGVSMAVAKAASASASVPLYQYLGGPNAVMLPVPNMNILNGGTHADSNVDIQEFMIAPYGLTNFKEAFRAGSEIYHTLKEVLKSKNLATGLGDEGGFAPNLNSNREALDLIVDAISKAGYKPGVDVGLAIDSAASEFFKDGKYIFEGQPRDAKYMIEYYENLIKSYPLISLEDPLAEDSWQDWVDLTAKIGDKVQIVGDDIFVTNPERLQKGIDMGVANALLVKLNQIGTVSETFDAVELAKTNKYNSMVSHRSGETEDTIISDFTVATNVGQLKTGAPARGERVAKYNQLLRIEEELGLAAKYAGKAAYKV